MGEPGEKDPERRTRRGGPGEEDPERRNPEHGEKKVTGILIVAKGKKYLTLVTALWQGIENLAYGGAALLISLRRAHLLRLLAK